MMRSPGVPVGAFEGFLFRDRASRPWIAGPSLAVAHGLGDGGRASGRKALLARESRKFPFERFIIAKKSFALLAKKRPKFFSPAINEAGPLFFQ